MSSNPPIKSAGFGLKLFKSAGVPVTAAVHRLLAEANLARDRRDWAQAARGYAEALKRDPDLAHIWVQSGHALKESGDADRAEAAYLKAVDLDPTAADPHIHIGHLRKQQGRTAEAGRAYFTAMKLDPSNADAIGELHRLASRHSEIRPQDILAVLAPHGAAPSLAGASDPVGAARTSLTGLADALRHGRSKVDPDAVRKLDAAITLLDEVGAGVNSGGVEAPAVVSPILFDVSDLIAYFRGSRLPTGIQRVQIEIITHALGSFGGPIQICGFMQDRDEWLEIPPDIFVVLCRLSLAGGDRNATEWLTALTRLQVVLSLAEGMSFPPDAVLVNLGTSWWISNYFLFIRQAKAAQAGVRYVPFVHDLIPLMASHCCASGLTQEFIGWAVGVFEHADLFLTNSEATKRDLLKVAALLNYEVDPDTVRVIRLDADFRKPSAPAANSARLGTWGLGRTPFVLFVSTIEARKNHVLAFDAWLALIRRHGLKSVPKLVCVGKRGWLDDAIFAKLEAHEELRDRVVILSGLSDADLADLYRACLFTLYPSTYEGWGLPVTESLCYGKVPLISNGSSLPEAGGPFAVYFEAGSVQDLVQALETLVYDPAYRRTCEDKIARGFKARTWRQIADEVLIAVAESPIPGARDPAAPPMAELGAYHGLARNVAKRIWPGMRSAEVFRTGAGWWGQDDFGCWTKPQGGELEIGFASPHRALRVNLLLRGTPIRSTTFRIEIDDDVVLSGDICADEHKWVGFQLEPVDDPHPRHRIFLHGDTTTKLADCTDGRDPRVVSLGLAGFFVCNVDDVAARMAFLEAVTLNNLDDLAFSKAAVRSVDPGARSLEAPTALELAS